MDLDFLGKNWRRI